jgi:putative membrane protein
VTDEGVGRHSLKVSNGKAAMNAASWMFAALFATNGTAAPRLSPGEQLENLGVTVIFGVVGIALAVLGFKVFDWITPRINVQHELTEKNNTAVAIVCAAIILGVCYIVASVVH